MRKLLLLFISVVLGSLFVTDVLAAEVKTPPLSSTNPLTNVPHFFTSGVAGSDLNNIVASLISWLILGAGLTSLLYLIAGGFRWLSAQGDPKALTAAQQTIFGAVIGFLITFSAYWIIEILQTVLGIKILAYLVPTAYAQVDLRDHFRLDNTRSIDAIFPGLSGGRSGFGGFISVLLSGAITIAGLAFLAYFIFGAYKFIISGGDQKSVDSAKKTITSALIGLLIVFASYWIIEILQTVTGVPILP